MSTDLFPGDGDLYRGFTYNDIAAGEVKGLSLSPTSASDNTVGLGFKTVWAPATSWVRPLATEQLQIVSDDVTDTAAGVGARAAAVTYLRDDYTPITEIVTLNGTTPVTLLNTDPWRVIDTRVALAGSTDSNVGTIALSGVTSGDPWDCIEPGRGISTSSVTTIQAGFKLYLHGAIVTTLDTTKIVTTRLVSGRAGDPMLERRRFESVELRDYVPVGILFEEGDDVAVEAMVSTGSAVLHLDPVGVVIDIKRFRSTS